MKHTLKIRINTTWFGTARPEPTTAAIAAKYGKAVGSSTAVIVAPSSQLDLPWGSKSGSSRLASRMRCRQSRTAAISMATPTPISMK